MKKIYLTLSIFSLLTSTNTQAAAPDTLTIQEAKDAITKHWPIKDTDIGYWTLVTSRQQNGYQFDAQKALDALDKENVKISEKSSMSDQVRTWYTISWGTGQEDNYEMMFSYNLGSTKKAK